MSSFIRKLAKLLPCQHAENVLKAYSLREYLKSSGWFKSVDEGLPVDAKGNPLPWYTYSSISFLKRNLPSGLNAVFEFGSGNSTLWWSKLAEEVVSCEHHQEWFKHFRTKITSNIEYLHRDLESGSYVNTIQDYKDKFDVVVVDGRHRVLSAKKCLPALNAGGVIVWDNSDRERYEPGYLFLKERGFRRIDFWGLGPINNHEWCTSVFYRDGNCLAL